MEFIYEIENSLTEDICNIMIEKFEQDPRKFPGETMGGVNLDVKRSTDLRISILPEWKDIDIVLSNALTNGLQKYYKYLETISSQNNIGERDIFNMLLFFENIHDTGYQIQRVKENEFYTWHHDQNIFDKRLITFIWYLNTLTLEDGGSTEFMCGKSINPVQGKLIFFPASWTYIHCGQPVKNTTKYICTGFIHHK